MPQLGDIELRDDHVDLRRANRRIWFFMEWTVTNHGEFWFPLMVGGEVPLFSSEKRATEWILQEAS